MFGDVVICIIIIEVDGLFVMMLFEINYNIIYGLFYYLLILEFIDNNNWGNKFVMCI